MTRITDVWFCCKFDLEDLAKKLGLSKIYFSSENSWEWVTGYVDDNHLDITRVNWVEPADTDTRIFLLGEHREFNRQLINQIVDQLKEIGIAQIHLGQWIYINGDDYDRVVIETI
jgi:hypothetical protein